ncbi:MAG: glycosyltransferase, partial [Lachnospiraceae bacterium]|nr:glycosyltransferase [Lachnospiraceae bacterium]
MADLDYKELYEKEALKCSDLAGKLSELEMRNQELEWNLGRIKGNPLWKMTSPLRKCMHWGIRQRDRLRNCGSVKGVFQKIKYKKQEKLAMRQFGSDSFPNADQIAAERATKFPRMVKISILVPLFNTPKEFLTEMIDSVMNQTYENWELCLGDGSDAEHGFVGEICKEYAAKANGRIVYKKLEKNMGISGNTNACLTLATGEFIGLFDHDDLLHPSVLYEYV